MAEVTKYHLLSASNGGSLFAELRRPFALLKTRRSLLLLSGFFIVFIGFTLVLTFSPSDSSFSPWIHGVFSSSSTASSSSEDFSPSASGRSELPSLSSYYFPYSPSRSRDAVPPVKRNASSSEVGQSSSIQSNSSNNSTIGVPAKENGGQKAKAVNVESNFTASLSKKKPESEIGATTAVSAAAGNQSRLGDRASSPASCDLYDGVWVRDDSYPLYKPGSCGLIDEHFNCYANRRPDNDYFKFKWKPRGCKLPRFNGDHMLNFLRGKRLVFVGDSINRNMWESLICILRTSVKDQSRVFESHGRLQFRTEAVYSFVFKDYNFTVEFFASPFLVRQWEVKGKDGKMKETLRIDLISESAAKFKTADILVFNTGHWWSHWKTSSGRDYYQEGNHVYSELNVEEAFRRALRTWAKWIDANVDPSKTHILFRGYSHSHFSGGQWNSGGACDNETEPIRDASYLREYPWKGKVLESTFKKMKTPVTYLNITMLTDYRKDGHPSIYRKRDIPEAERRSPLSFQDCSHWCLPGVPDAWNELLYAELLIKQHQRQHQQKQSKT